MMNFITRNWNWWYLMPPFMLAQALSFRYERYKAKKWFQPNRNLLAVRGLNTLSVCRALAPQALILAVAIFVGSGRGLAQFFKDWGAQFSSQTQFWILSIGLLILVAALFLWIQDRVAPLFGIVIAANVALIDAFTAEQYEACWLATVVAIIAGSYYFLKILVIIAVKPLRHHHKSPRT